MRIMRLVVDEKGIGVLWMWLLGFWSVAGKEAYNEEHG